MSTSHKSFWSSVPGLATAVAGILTGVVGLGTLAVQLGVVGDKDNSSNTSSESPAPDGSGTSGVTSGSGATGAAAKVSFTVDLSAVTLTAVKTEGVVTVTNQGTTALAVKKPQLSGAGADKFSVDAADCTSTDVAVDGSCRLVVTYEGGLEETSATMTVGADDTSETEKVALKGSLA